MPDSPVLAASNWPTNGDLIADVARLYLADLTVEQSVLDATYGRGKWWTKYQPPFLTTNDIVAGRAHYQYDFRHLPEHWANSFDVVAFDPPYMAPGGRKTSTIHDFNDRYGMHSTPPKPEGLQVVINDGIKEMARVLKPKGLLLVKCQDYINAAVFWNGTFHTQVAAMENGLVQIDRLEHVRRPGPQPPRPRQFHARRNMSTLFVFKLTTAKG